ncbi:chorismate lyase/3-hydroxybenzoate synthase [Tahibacter aquaticus]|uniref:Chorismate lyase/3-hydroxybenzoate synthase n=1 Tax=Tahibacter aquaticus TaxID=520092 RepID=A0A4R6Z7K7_9GAMM|nr:pteridine-dependent deoxygenase [Tahibacter aquaticus]TDR47800.1 chorismate lyase/3-hydroxybenzoate synthase [Tahibacter aquaticus]
MNRATVLPALDVDYVQADLGSLLAQGDVLAVLGFGSQAPRSDDPRYLRIGLEPLGGQAPLEVWRAQGDIRHGRDGLVRWAASPDYCFGAIEVAESDYADLAAATEAAYAALSAFALSHNWPQLLRIWNYLAAINEGSGDAERYKHFCTGRSAGMRSVHGQGFPAASAIGRSDGEYGVQVYWLAAREPGLAVENPRQVSAWRYPREYGPTAPTFARAMRGPCAQAQLHISGTAAVVGHQSRHDGDIDAQLDETFANLSSLLASADMPAFGASSVLKAYVRHAADMPPIAAALARRLPDAAKRLVLLGDICRVELLVEIDGIHTAAD